MLTLPPSPDVDGPPDKFTSAPLPNSDIPILIEIVPGTPVLDPPVDKTMSPELPLEA